MNFVFIPFFMANLGLSSLQSLEALNALLSGQHDEDEDEDEEYKHVTPNAQLGPGNIGPPPRKGAEGATACVEKNSKDIWSVEEVAEGPHCDDDDADMRPQPEYEIFLQQSVRTEDVFLGLSGKDPSSVCCEAVLVKIKLPETKATDVVLDVKENFIDLQTPKYKLGLHLRRPVDIYRGKAQFFSEKSELQVTLVTR